jgi:hypothetical protein
MLKATREEMRRTAASVIKSPVFDLSSGFIALYSYSVIRRNLGTICFAVPLPPPEIKMPDGERRAKEIPLYTCKLAQGAGLWFYHDTPRPLSLEGSLADSQWRAAWLQQ